MSMRKILLLALISVSVLAIIVNVLIFSSLTDKYFRSYMMETYDMHVDQIIDFSKRALMDDFEPAKQISEELESHLTDPIIQIKLYNTDGESISDVRRDYQFHDEMMGRGMMRFMMDPFADETEMYQIYSGDIIIGVLYITRYSSVENSYVVWRFKSSLLRNSLLAVLIAASLAVIIGIIISKKTTKALKETMLLSQTIRSGQSPFLENTGITEIDEIRSSLRSLHYQLKLRQKSRRELTDSLIHQTRTPLTILKTHLEAMQDGLVDDRYSTYATCHEQIDNLNAIIEDMNNIVDADQQTDRLVIKRIDIGQLVLRIISGLSAQFEKKGIVLSQKKDVHIFAQTDQYKLDQVIYNLLNNAYKYTKEGGEVSIDIQEADNYIEIIVKDTGIGMKKQTIDKIFDAYFRGPGALFVSGDGLGLFIVKKNLERLKGEIDVISEPGSGSRFTVKIPKNMN